MACSARRWFLNFSVLCWSVTFRRAGLTPGAAGRQQTFAVPPFLEGRADD
jgi:hypothetical protein